MPDAPLQVLVTGSCGLIGGVVIRTLGDKYTFSGLDRAQTADAPDIPTTVADVSNFAQLAAQILRLESQGKSDEDIAQILTRKGFRSAHHAERLPSTVRLMRLQHGRRHRYWGPRPRRVSGSLTVSQIATVVGVKPHWISHLMRCGRITVKRDAETGLSLFPDRPETLEAFRQLRDGDVSELRHEGELDASLGRPG